MMDAMFSPEEKLHSSSDTVSANLSAFKKKKKKNPFLNPVQALTEFSH